MHEMLMNDYTLNIKEACTIDGYKGFTDGEYSYFTTTVEEKEAFYIEQFILAHYLHEQGNPQIALPIQNKEEEWFTTKGDQHHVVCQIKNQSTPQSVSHVSALARFHKSSQSFAHEPERISCFGLWRELWIQKLDYFEEIIPKRAISSSNLAYQRMMEIFPYMIGTTETAIQILRECEEETRFGENDAPAICFIRYDGQLMEKIIWPNEFVYDHFARDLAEILRMELLKDEDFTVTYTNIREHIANYEQIQPISIFAWRLIYARLLFPTHFYDLFDEILEAESEEYLPYLNEMIRIHHHYEQKLAHFYKELGIDSAKYEMTTVEWLHS